MTLEGKTAKEQGKRMERIVGYDNDENTLRWEHQQKKRGYRRTHPCSLWVRRARRIELKLAFWVCGLLLGACGQGSMLPGRTRGNQGLSRYATLKGSPDAERFSGGRKVLRTQKGFPDAKRFSGGNPIA